jgi:hypothetical protein
VVAIHNGRDWKDIHELSRATRIPAGFSVIELYAGDEPTFLQSIAI